MDSRAIALDLLVAQACDAARNKYATAHVNQAHAALVETAIRNEPTAFAMFPPPSSFEEAGAHIEKLVRALDELVYQTAREANDNSTTTVDVPRSLFYDAWHDSSLRSDLAEAAERAAEDALEVA